MTTCHGCHFPLESIAQIRTYHTGCDPQGRVEMLERALRELAEMTPSATFHDAGSLLQHVNEIARAALGYRPAQMKGRE